MIYDEELVDRYEKLIFTTNNPYYVQIISRQKYKKTSEKIICNSKICYENLLSQLKRSLAECGDIIKGKEGMVLYLADNPCSVEEAMNNLTKEWQEIQFHRAAGKDNGRFEKILRNPVGVLMNTLHKTTKSISLICIDVDTKDPEIFERVMEFVNKDIIRCIVETHGGYHILCDRTKMDIKDSKNIFYHLAKEDWIKDEDGKALVEILTGTQTPIPGTLQNGFKVKFKNEIL